MEAVKPKVLMVGPGRNVMGGISTVVNLYHELGIEDRVKLLYISSMVDGNKLKKFRVALSSYLQFCKCIKDYDIVHIHMAAQASFIRKSFFVEKAYNCGKKIIIHQHAADFDDYYFKQCDDAKRKKIKAIFGMANKVIVLSEEWKEFFGKNICDPNKIEIFHNGVTIPDYEKNNYFDHNILFLGRLGKRKGTYDLIESAKNVIKEIPDVQFYLGGDGEIEKCKKFVKDYGLTNNFHFLGWVRTNEKIRYLEKCSIFILPSYHEGMPMSVLEAMSYGLATISTNVGGIPQVIENGVNGLIVEPGDTKKMTKELVDLILNPLLKRKYGIKARVQIMDKFNMRFNLDKLIGMYYQLITDMEKTQ